MTIGLGVARGGLAISGLYDLEPIRLSYLNAKLGLDAPVAAATVLSRVRLRSPPRSSSRTAPPSWLSYADNLSLMPAP